ncbi:MAG: hypothetical protein CVV32_03405 [Methanomicrobiales archaeon HGW-Methanomicrobiales-3]|nr:MAG: hypothetical protein CVV32_03405 [Methanomicrobiales archaeon HGW-Methanomicrobiales-3]
MGAISPPNPHYDELRRPRLGAPAAASITVLTELSVFNQQEIQIFFKEPPLKNCVPVAAVLMDGGTGGNPLV